MSRIDSNPWWRGERYQNERPTKWMIFNSSPYMNNYANIEVDFKLMVLILLFVKWWYSELQGLEYTPHDDSELSQWIRKTRLQNQASKLTNFSTDPSLFHTFQKKHNESKTIVYKRFFLMLYRNSSTNVSNGYVIMNKKGPKELKHKEREMLLTNFPWKITRFSWGIRSEYNLEPTGKYGRWGYFFTRH